MKILYNINDVDETKEKAMRKRKRLSGILAGFICLFPFSHIPVYAEAYWPSGPEVEAEAAVVMEASTGTILYEKNPHEQLYPASITKIMTTLLAVENCELDEEVTFSYESVHNIDRESTHISRDVGEIMTMDQCLYAVMLGSANDCAYAVAEHVGKGYENFIAMMNDKASQLGCKDTHFNNPHGLTDEQHYTSAYDMALISQAALRNDTFRVITGTKRYTIPITNKHPNEETPLVNHHKMLTNYQGDTAYLYEDCIGGKTGYTDLARRTLVTFAERDNMTLICVVMKENSNVDYIDTAQLLDYCFDNFTMWNISENESQYKIAGTANTEIFAASKSFVDLDRESQIVLPKTAVFEDASFEVIENENEDEVVVLQYKYGDRMVGSARIAATNAQVEMYDFHNNLPEKKTKRAPLKINTKYIAVGIAAFIGAAIIGMILYYLLSNFYIIRHKLKSKRKEKNRFKVIKSGKHSKWKMRW